jgi:hypothetical protein
MPDLALIRARREQDLNACRRRDRRLSRDREPERGIAAVFPQLKGCIRKR